MQLSVRIADNETYNTNRYAKNIIDFDGHQMKFHVKSLNYLLRFKIYLKF